MCSRQVGSPTPQVLSLSHVLLTEAGLVESPGTEGAEEQRRWLDVTVASE